MKTLQNPLIYHLKLRTVVILKVKGDPNAAEKYVRNQLVNRVLVPISRFPLVRCVAFYASNL